MKKIRICLFVLSPLILLGPWPTAVHAVIPLDPFPAWESTPLGHVATGGGWLDVNGDGWLDLVAANGNDISRQTVVVYHNQGDGTLPLTPTWSSGDIDYHGHLDLGDVNGDGLADVVVGVYIGPAGFSEPGRAKLYLNDGAGGFSATPDWISGVDFYCFRVALGDADGDGDLDLACAAGESYGLVPERFKIFYNEGGTLESLPSWESQEIGYALDVSWADVDLDGDQDLLFAGERGPNRLYRNDQVGGGGGISTSATWQSADSPGYANTSCFGDWNDDGYPELAVADNDQLGGQGFFKVYENVAGALTASPVWYSNNGGYGSHVSWGDPDFDGDLDLVTGRWWQRLRIYENTGGTLTSRPPWKSETFSVIENVFWGDVDNADLRTGGVSHATGDGDRTYVKLGQTPVRSVDEVLVDGVALPPGGYVAHLGGGWISLSSPPATGVPIEARYTYSASLDLGVTNWDDSKGNYLFLHLGGAVDAPVLASGPERLRVRPNPVRTSTVLSWDGGAAADARLAIYDVAGRVVRTLHQGPLAEGHHTWEWQARDATGVRLASGVYFARLRIGRKSTSLKVVVR